MKLDIEKIEKFIWQAKNTKSRLVFVTSGGTSVPLEKNTVRLIFENE